MSLGQRFLLQRGSVVKSMCANSGSGPASLGREESGTAKVLVVEDEPEMMSLLCFVLQRSGFCVVQAVDGMDALRKFDTERPDLVVLDLNLPKVSGFRLLRLFKRAPVEDSAPVIVVTALDFQEAEEIVKSGADDFITKPFDPALLVHKAESVLARLPAVG